MTLSNTSLCTFLDNSHSTLQSVLFSSSVPSQSPLTYHLGWHGVKSEQFSCMKNLVWMLMEAMPVTQSTPLVATQCRCRWCPLQIVQHFGLLWHTTVYIYFGLHTMTLCIIISCFCPDVSTFNPVLKSVLFSVVIHDNLISGWSKLKLHSILLYIMQTAATKLISKHQLYFISWWSSCHCTTPAGMGFVCIHRHAKCHNDQSPEMFRILV